MDSLPNQVLGGDGCIEQVAPGQAEACLSGWLVAEAAACDHVPELALDIEGVGFRVVTADQQVLGRDDAPPGARGFAWPLPPELRDGRQRVVRAWHLGSGRELAGSPLSLAAIPGAVEAAELRRPLLTWPNGLAGLVAASAPTELAEGLWSSAERPALSLRFEAMLSGAAGDGQPPRRGVRVIADATAARVTLHLRPGSDWPAADIPVQILLRCWLPEATAVAVQAHLEIWLTRRVAGAFVPLRRLRRARVFRRPGLISADLTLLAEEAEAPEQLWLTLVALDAKGLGSLVPEITQPVETAGEGFEDWRLDGAFAHCAELVRALGEAAAEQHPLLPIGPSAAQALPGCPAEAAGAGHPFTQIILPVYNGDETVRLCLRSLRSAGTGPFQVVVLDDASRAFTAAMLREEVGRDPRFILHRRDTNRGYTKSVNEGVQLTRADWVVVLNSDTLVPTGWLDRLHRAAQACPGTGMVGPLSNAATWQSIPGVKRADGSWSTNDMIEPRHLAAMQALLDRHSERAYPEYPILNGFCTLVARAVFDRVGLLDEEAFPMGYGEETDLCLRARRAGFRLTVADDTFVFHHKSISFGSSNRRRLTRAGGLEMTNKHLGVIVPALEQLMQSCAPMIRLRTRIADDIAGLD